MAHPIGNRTPNWVLFGRLVTVGFLGGLITLALIGVEFWVVLAVAIQLVFAGGRLRDPR